MDEFWGTPALPNSARGGVDAGTEELGAERTAAHQKGRRPVSANPVGAGGTAHSGTVWRRLRLAPLGSEVGRAWWEKREETKPSLRWRESWRFCCTGCG